MNQFYNLKVRTGTITRQKIVQYAYNINSWVSWELTNACDFVERQSTHEKVVERCRNILPFKSEANFLVK